MSSLITTNKQRGDTIIEVLLAMAVLGMVLGTSFGIVNRSLATGRDAQERSEATKLAESQLEKLKTASSDPDNGFFSISETSIYCITYTRITDTLEVVEFDTNGIIEDDVDLNTYAVECKAGPDGRYRMSIIRSENVFTVRTRWESIRGEQLNEAKLIYRTYSYSTREYPVVSTNSTVSISGLNATVTGNVTDQGKTSVTERGFIYNTTAGQHPSAGTKIAVGSGLGEFSTVLSLSPNTVYYVRSFATNGSGTSYGSEVEFTTQAITAPVLGAAGASSTGTVSTVVSSTVNNGGTSITRQGAIVGPTSTLALDSNRTINDSPGGAVVSTTIGGLLPNTTYFAKTFAINSVGTSYSAPFSFKTSAIVSSIPLGTPTTFNGNTYYLSTQRATWSQAKAISTASGGHLVSINSLAENNFVSTLAAGQGTWLGLNDIANEGVWVWDSDDPSVGAGSYRNWSAGEPNNYLYGSTDEDVAVMNWSGGAWNDWFNDSTTTAYFVIEYDGSPITNKSTVQGRSYASCVTTAPAYPCTTTATSVYSRTDFRVDYSISAVSGGPGYNTLILNYSDYTGGSPTPPDSLYDYKVNVYVNGAKTLSGYKLKPSGGIAHIPIGQYASISTVSIEWTNNEWVPVNTYQYDPDLQINAVSVGFKP